MTTIQEIKSVDEYDALLASNPQKTAIVYFWATWCLPCTQMDVVFQQLSSENPDLIFVRVEAEGVPEISEKLDITSVPSFIFVKDGAVVDKVVGANAPELTKKISGKSATAAAPVVAVEKTKEDLNTRLKKLVNKSKVVLFMKGEPAAPRCGFSRTIIDILDRSAIKYSTFDILEDEEVRQGLKVFSNWPTYPQLYVDGQLVGGLDIVKEMEASGELKEVFSTPS